MNPNALLGIAKIFVNGREYRSSEGASLQISGRQRNEQKYMGGTGFSNEQMPAVVEASFKFDAGVSLEELEAMDDVTVGFECDTGQEYVLPNAWNEPIPKVTTSNGGEVPVMFKSNTHKRIA